MKRLPLSVSRVNCRFLEGTKRRARLAVSMGIELSSEPSEELPPTALDFPALCKVKHEINTNIRVVSQVEYTSDLD